MSFEDVSYNVKPAHPDKKLNIFDRWLVQLSKRAWNNSNLINDGVIQTSRQAGNIASVRQDTLSDNHRSNHLRWYKANGGMIIEIQTWNESRHEWANELHIVPEGENLADEIASIITQQFLRY